MPPRWSQDQSSRAESVFQEYRDANNPNFIGPEGVQQLLNDIGIVRAQPSDANSHHRSFPELALGYEQIVLLFLLAFLHRPPKTSGLSPWHGAWGPLAWDSSLERNSLVACARFAVTPLILFAAPASSSTRRCAYLSLSLFITIFLLSHYIYYLVMVLRSLARRDSVTFSASLSTFVAQARYLHMVTPTFHCCSSMREHLHSCRRA